MAVWPSGNSITLITEVIVQRAWFLVGIAESISNSAYL